MSSSESGTGVGCLVLLFVIGVIGYGAYNALNNSGWVPHTRTVDMYMAGDWLVGENRTCIAFQMAPGGSNNIPQITSIDCPVGDYSEKPHNIQIEFWGRTSRPEIMQGAESLEDHFEWRCTRHLEGFTCWALN